MASWLRDVTALPGAGAATGRAATVDVGVAGFAADVAAVRELVCEVDCDFALVVAAFAVAPVIITVVRQVERRSFLLRVIPSPLSCLFLPAGPGGAAEVVGGKIQTWARYDP